jgi:hypothetical protein
MDAFTVSSHSVIGKFRIAQWSLLHQASIALQAQESRDSIVNRKVRVICNDTARLATHKMCAGAHANTAKAVAGHTP